MHTKTLFTEATYQLLVMAQVVFVCVLVVFALPLSFHQKCHLYLLRINQTYMYYNYVDCRCVYMVHIISNHYRGQLNIMIMSSLTICLCQNFIVIESRLFWELAFL